MNDIEIIMKVFNKISFFQDLQKKIPITHVRHLIKEFKYESKERGDVVFQFDELGIDYYILLKGSLFLLLPKNTLNVDYTPEKQYVASQYLTEPPLIPINNVISFKSLSEINSGEMKILGPRIEISASPNIKADIQKINQNNNNTPKNLLAENRNSHISPSQKKRFSKASEDFFKRKTTFSENILKDNEKTLMMSIRNAFPDFEIVKKLEAVTGFGEIALMSNLKRYE